jgi:uroporphyrinogen-III decarboxylase
MRWNRTEYIAYMKGEGFERPMFCELFGPLKQLVPEWQEQGASEDEINMIAFDWDYLNLCSIGCNTSLLGGSDKVIENNDEYQISIDRLGRKTKLCKNAATIALPMDYPVTTMDDWLKLKPRYEFTKERINIEQLKKAAYKREHEDTFIKASIEGGFDLARQLMGEEELCVSYYTQPELIRDIMETITTTSTEVLKRAVQLVQIDQLSVHEDMAGKSGSLIGPNQIKEFIVPYYQKCWDIVKESGGSIFDQDSDGDMNIVIDSFLESGLNSMHPFEPAAGMDMVKSKELYGDKLMIKGGIDKHVLRGTKDDIRKELEYKMQPKMLKGGIVFGLDHRITNGTPIENYRYYVKLGREVLGIPPLDPKIKGWGRMAF